MSRKRCKRTPRRALAPTIVALHLNPEVSLPTCSLCSSPGPLNKCGLIPIAEIDKALQ